MDNLRLVREEMQREGIDALIALSSCNFYYTSGFQITFPGLTPAMTLTPTDVSVEPVMIVSELDEIPARRSSNINDIRSYPTWIDVVNMEYIMQDRTGKAPKYCRDASETAFALLSDIVEEKGLQESRIAIEISSSTDAISHAYYSLLVKYNPKATFLDEARILEKLQAIKNDEEIKILRATAKLAEKGLQAVLDGGLLGETIQQQRLRYQEGVVKEMINNLSPYLLEQTRLDIFAGDPARTTGFRAYKIAKGDVVMIDCGATLQGYESDINRTVVVGKASALQRKVYETLQRGFEEALSKMRPGVRMSEVFNAAQEVIRKSGISWFNRGHLGHSVGLEWGGVERAPFISNEEEMELQPGMVMCVETPFFVEGLGSFNIEDMVLITPDGHELLIDLPHDLIEL